MSGSNTDGFTRWIVAIVALEAVATVLDLVAGPHAVLHWEERVNARNGALFSCGHGANWAALQYRTFCGGCTAEGLLVAPLFQVAGVTVGAWKLVVAALHLGIVAAIGLLARKLAGPLAGILAVLLLMAAPGFYREQALTGWGNHAESSLFPLIAALGPGPMGARAVIAGGVLGLGIWFAPITAHAVPALAWLHRGGRHLVGFGAGLALGLLPVVSFLRARPAGATETGELWTGLSLAPPGELLGLLSGQGIGGGLWSPFEYGELGLLGPVWWGTLWLVALVGAWLQARRKAPLRGLLALALGVLIALFAVRHDLWRQLPEFPDHPTFNLRYLAPFVPWLVLGAAVAAVQVPRLRRVTGMVIAGLILSGLALRGTSWSAWHPDRLAEPVVTRAERLDRTVPLGQPPQPNRRQQGRPQDLRAALDWLGDHRDSLDTCRGVHLAELGRRLGVASDPSPWVAGALAAADTPASRALLIDGIARGLGTPGDLAGSLAALGPLGPATGQAWGHVNAHRHRAATYEALQAALPASVVDGICAARRAPDADRRRGLRPGWHVDDPGDPKGCPAPAGARR